MSWSRAHFRLFAVSGALPRRLGRFRRVGDCWAAGWVMSRAARNVAGKEGVKFSACSSFKSMAYCRPSIVKLHRLGRLRLLEVVKKHRAPGHEDIPFSYCLQS